MSVCSYFDTRGRCHVVEVVGEVVVDRGVDVRVIAAAEPGGRLQKGEVDAIVADYLQRACRSSRPLCRRLHPGDLQRGRSAVPRRTAVPAAAA
jgi:hypothetical protein